MQSSPFIHITNVGTIFFTHLNKYFMNGLYTMSKWDTFFCLMKLNDAGGNFCVQKLYYPHGTSGSIAIACIIFGMEDYSVVIYFAFSCSANEPNMCGCFLELR